MYPWLGVMGARGGLAPTGWLLAAAVALSSCSGVSLVRSVTCVGPEADPDEYAVYAAVLDRHDAPLTDSIDARLNGDGMGADFPDGVSGEVTRDWRAKQGQPACLRRVPMEDPRIPKGRDPSFGTLRFSRVGFNAARTQAVVSLELRADCGQAAFYRLRREPDGWRVIYDRNASVVHW